ncbi:conserved exported protein of unknown function [Candidatus Filomicrobium marinum]|uniref:Uncharacterized protein n=1 Tax=Candidatus Filomicrobium marinum TaxID=1608628 RepID=A0A0D6JII4_9HYPH|nr:hypothetical protein [Candidatus Filomicrobium marinum]CFX36105.1 conserved exported protein of unknown function [Candidatus Filomicrobium marinum]CPR21768.1 conserved exported protein of unknown function [Candidatus Filomicrobium marinum]
MRFIIGLAIGIIIGAATSGYAQTVVGTGYLIGWDVIKDGTVICSDPFIWEGTMELECD